MVLGAARGMKDRKTFGQMFLYAVAVKIRLHAFRARCQDKGSSMIISFDEGRLRCILKQAYRTKTGKSVKRAHNVSDSRRVTSLKDLQSISTMSSLSGFWMPAMTLI